MNSQFIEVEIYHEDRDNERILINPQHVIKIERCGKDDAIIYLTDGSKYNGISGYKYFLNTLMEDCDTN